MNSLLDYLHSSTEIRKLKPMSRDITNDNNELSMGDSPDSRTASFARKRAHDVASRDPTTSPQKRLKHEIFDIEHSEDDVPVSGGPSGDAGGFEDARSSNASEAGDDDNIEERPAVDRSDQVTKKSGIVPSVNWNSGSKAKIRISLGRGLSTPISPPRSASLQSGSPNHIVDVNIRTPISNDPADDSIQPKAVAPVLASKGISIKNSFGSLTMNESMPFQGRMSSAVSQEDQEPPTEFESDGGVALNIQNSDQESIEISEANVDKSVEIEKMIQSEQTESDGEINESEDGDAMMKYYESNQLNNEQQTESGTVLETKDQQPKLQVLADLDPEDLKFQLRYFHITKNLDAIDRKSLVRCLICAQEGHMAESCTVLRCDVCGIHKQHSTKNCPQTKRCAKCRERGHQESNCQYKFQRILPEEMTCDLCQRDGHNENNCELLWRTSGRPWKSDLTDKKIRLECYECGRAGHLGNDCNTRRPKKWMGTSTWSLPGKESILLESQKGISIKGRAQQKTIDALDDSDDDTVTFFRPKVPEPVRKGQIRIDSQAFGGNRPINQSPNKNGPDARKPDGGYHQRDNTQSFRGGGWNGHQGKGNSRPRDQSQYSYRPSDRRSVSPHYPARGSNYNVDRYRTPAYSGQEERNIRYRDRNQYGVSESYRPMPSAAQSAWKRYKT